MIDYSKQLEYDLNWREAELASLKLLVIESPKESIRYIALLRALWSMLYAHYEGFCKFAWDLYLDGLKSTRLKRKRFKRTISILSLESEFKNFRGNLSSNNIWAFCETKFPELLNQNIDFYKKLETNSNLWPDILKRNSFQAGLECKLADQYESELRTLVSRRNEIAHGQKMIIQSLEEYNKYQNAVFFIMYELAIEIVDCFENQKYLISD